MELIKESKQIPLSAFFDAYYLCRKRKRGTTNALKFEQNYRENLVKLWEEVNTRTYKISRSITFIVTRPKPREVFAADFRDRVIHHIIMLDLEPLFEQEFIDDCYSCRKGRGTLFGVQRLYDKIKEFSCNYTKDCYIGKFDIKGFFMNINKTMLHKKLKSFIEEKYTGDHKELLQYLVRKTVIHKPQENCIRKDPVSKWSLLPPEKSLFTCDANSGLPIGNLTSQCFANFYLNDFDHWMSEMFNGYYGRYVDDFYVIARTKEEITSKIKEIEKYLKENLGLTLHDKKRYVQPYYKGVTFIGTYIRKNIIKLGNRSLGNLYSVIHRFNKMDPTPENVLEFSQILNSYLGFMRHGDSKARRAKIWNKLSFRVWKDNGIFFIDKNFTKISVNPKKLRSYYIKQKLKNHEEITEMDLGYI